MPDQGFEHRQGGGDNEDYRRVRSTVQGMYRRMGTSCAEDEVDNPDNVRKLVRKEQARRSATMSLLSPVVKTNFGQGVSSPPEYPHKEEGLTKYPQYEGTVRGGRTSAREREKLALARLKREHYMSIQRRGKINSVLRRMVTSHNWTPTGSYAAPSQPLVAISSDIIHTSYQQGSVLGDLAYCDCEACKFNLEQEVKADKLWYGGEKEKAIQIQPQVCKYRLKVENSAIAHRSPKPRTPKSVNWKSRVEKRLGSGWVPEVWKPSEDETFSSELSPEWMECEKEIQRVEQQIRRLIGSADWEAEVVVIVTSLHISRKAFAGSQRVIRFLEAKGVEFFQLDANSDVGPDSLDVRLLRKWLAAGRLVMDPRKVASKVQMTALAPQILVDGVPLGTFEDLQTMEDDYDLDYVLARKACPNCLYDRNSLAKACMNCGARFTQLVCSEYLLDSEITRLLQINEVNSSRIKSPTPRDFERRRRQLGLRRLDEDMAAWLTPEMSKKFGVPSVGFFIDFDE